MMIHREGWSAGDEPMPSDCFCFDCRKTFESYDPTVTRCSKCHSDFVNGRDGMANEERAHSRANYGWDEPSWAEQMLMIADVKGSEGR